jgi:hypothetical protein
MVGAPTVGMYTPSVIQMASLGLLGPQGTEVSRLAQHLPRRLLAVARGANRFATRERRTGNQMNENDAYPGSRG